MEEILRTNDLVLISAATAILAGCGIEPFVADSYAAAVEGSLGFLPRRMLVPAALAPEARLVLTQAGLGAELRPPPE